MRPFVRGALPPSAVGCRGLVRTRLTLPFTAWTQVPRRHSTSTVFHDPVGCSLSKALMARGVGPSTASVGDPLAKWMSGSLPSPTLRRSPATSTIAPATPQ